MLDLNDCCPSNDDTHQCKICKDGFEEYKKKEDELFEKYGFIIHGVIEDKDHPFGVNFHTHGLPESFDHPDFQICFPLDMKMACEIIHNLVYYIREEDAHYTTGQIVSDIIEPFNITFISVIENEDLLLRIIFPDEKGCLIKEEINPEYLSQWD